MSGTESQDLDLVRRAQAGDRAAFVELYQLYVNEIHHYLRNQVGDPDDAEDLTSETFLRVVRSLDRFAGRSSFRTWLYEVARNQLRDHWRANGRRPMASVDVESLAAQEPEPAGRSAATDLGRRILDELPANYRQVLQLRILDGRSVRDTAEELGKSDTNVKVLTHRALRKAAEVASRLESSRDEHG
jgi:RNA polymerase sigma-70 factor (ECF subfamily)